ncbi:MAG: SCP2 sterol-binding domain-containing protein [Gammaproteobacteria bacterium]
MITQLPFDAFEKLLNKYVSLDPEMPQHIAKLEGQVMAIKCREMPFPCYLSFDKTQIRVLAEYKDEAHATISGSTLSLLLLANSKGADAFSMFSQDINLEGDTEFAEKVKHIFDNMEIDWEEQLSNYTGDVVAHQVGNVARKFCQWLKTGKETWENNLTEYLQEESRCVPPKEEVEDFFADINGLRMDVDRLLARVQLLQ